MSYHTQNFPCGRALTRIGCLPPTFLLSLTSHSEGNERTFELEQILRNSPFLHLWVLRGPVTGSRCHSESGMPALGSCIEPPGKEGTISHRGLFEGQREAAASPMSLCSLPYAFRSSSAGLQGKPALRAMRKGIFTTFSQVKSLSSLNFT